MEGLPCRYHRAGHAGPAWKPPLRSRVCEQHDAHTGPAGWVLLAHFQKWQNITFCLPSLFSFPYSGLFSPCRDTDYDVALKSNLCCPLGRQKMTMELWDVPWPVASKLGVLADQPPEVWADSPCQTAGGGMEAVV